MKTLGKNYDKSYSCYLDSRDGLDVSFSPDWSTATFKPNRQNWAVLEAAELKQLRDDITDALIKMGEQ